jgi:sucrose-6F-phosphate phosphohydrolase
MTIIRLFATPLDGSLVGNPASTAHFASLWSGLPARRRPLLCYNTGRLAEDVLALIANGSVPRPDFIIAAVGTEIYDLADGGRLDGYVRRIGEGWDRAAVDLVAAAIPGITRQPEAFQTQWKSSWYLPSADTEAIAAIQRQLSERGVAASVEYSNSRDLDFVPLGTSKGRALAWLISHLGLDPGEVLVVGDRGSDRSVFEIPGVRGMLVENAQPELVGAMVGRKVFQSPHPFAEGLIDGLCHHRVFDRATVGGEGAGANDREMRLLLSAEAQAEVTPEERAVIAEGYREALGCIRRNLTPRGFSACSLDDNEVVGTDVNYRSVWGRDAAITILGTLATDQPDIIDGARRSLDTLLGATTADGQVPANVRISDGVPDYSGVGGIAAIDSALWLVIASHGFVQHTEDMEFLVRHRPRLEAVMRWLQAQDANRDGLLEIPEAGDWTDLFGRSYNVLYDEILWYRAKVCWGQLLIRLGRDDDAIAQLRDSQHIRGRILHVFWPTTTRPEEHTLTSFADRQFSLGDAQYLLAEVSPFGFSWRCDVLGNVLGFLFNVLDVPKARTTLAFLWGVGANQPWPVANLYPVVQAGDPDWKAYYTVNLLNLPHHYHNGGIWPFIGGLWVRFIHRLGQHNAAAHELARLAHCNRQGRQRSWEFNEWCHGTTGRPMGKAYQAWSAAAYIGACHELGFAGPAPAGESPTSHVDPAHQRPP